MTGTDQDISGPAATPPTRARRLELARRRLAAWRGRRAAIAGARRAARAGERRAAATARELARRQGEPGPVLARSAWAALALIAVLVAGATVVSLAESYRGLYDWAAAHGYGPGLWAAVFPVMVDVFVVTGELAAFVSLVLLWPARTRVAAWCLTLFGLAASVAGNVAHLPPGVPAAWRAGAAVPPIAAATALFVGLGVLKRIAEAGGFAIRRPAPLPVPVPMPRPRRRRVPRDTPRPDRPEPGTAGAERAALVWLWQLRDAGLTIPSMRELARTRFASPGSPEGNKRAAARVLARLAAGVRPGPDAELLNLNHDHELEPAR